MFSFRLRADAANPVPGGGGGACPRHPCAEPPAALADLAAVVPEGGLGGWGCLPALPLVYFAAPSPRAALARPAFSLLFSPIPPAPLPGGKGEPKSLFRRGLRPRHPRAEPGQHLQTLPLWYLKGGLAVGVASLPCLELDFFPPSPLPPFPAGRGEFFCFLMQGASPLASPSLNPRGTCRPCRCGVRRGGLPSLSPAHPAVCLLFCPHPPAPLPLRGRGRILLYFAGGFAPGTPALNRLRHLQLLPSRHPAQGACGSPQKRQEAVPYEQCR